MTSIISNFNINYENFKKLITKDLKTLYKENGIKNYSKKKKQELIEYIIDNKELIININDDYIKKMLKEKKKKNKKIYNPKIEDIEFFQKSSRSKNGEYNTIRENIINNIINNEIPVEFYEKDTRWTDLRNAIYTYFNINENDKIICTIKGGRNNKYDFELQINGKIHRIEFKFNTCSVDDTPQFVSPMNPSQYVECDCSYEEYYYDNYFIPLVKEYKLPLPTKEEFLKKIHLTSPECVKKHQEKYYRGCKKSSKYSGDENDINFYKSAKKKSYDSIYNFISNYGLKKDKLTDYLLNSQKDKYYMLYKNGSISFQTIDPNNYIITEVTKNPENNRYIAKTKTGKQLNILLRWKNGNGIALPSFQIS